MATIGRYTACGLMAEVMVELHYVSTLARVYMCLAHLSVSGVREGVNIFCIKRRRRGKYLVDPLGLQLYIPITGTYTLTY